MLVLADTDGTRVDFYQLCQWILQAARNTDGAANGRVQVRKFFAGNVVGRVDTGARFVDHEAFDVLEVVFLQN